MPPGPSEPSSIPIARNATRVGTPSRAAPRAIAMLTARIPPTRRSRVPASTPSSSPVWRPVAVRGRPRSAAAADDVHARRLDRPRLDRRTLVRLARARKAGENVRPRREVLALEALVEQSQELRGGVDSVLCGPIGEVFVPGPSRRGPPLPVPAQPALVAVGRDGVDADRLVARRAEPRHEPAERPASELHDARRGVTEPLADDRPDGGEPSFVQGHRPAGRLGGSDRAYEAPRSTHSPSSSSPATSSASTRSQPGIERPRITMKRASVVATRSSDASGSTRTRMPPCPLAAIAMLPPTRNARPPKILCSVTSAPSRTSPRIRAASASSYAMPRSYETRP